MIVGRNRLAVQSLRPAVFLGPIRELPSLGPTVLYSPTPRMNFPGASGQLSVYMPFGASRVSWPDLHIGIHVRRPPSKPELNC
jgi:hypothetical protein